MGLRVLSAPGLLLGVFSVGLLASCSLLFSAPEEGGPVLPDPPVRCLGQQRIYPLGEPLGPGHYQHLDLAQGTVSFWAQPLVFPLSGESVLVDLAGVRIATNAAGDLDVDIPGAPSASFPNAVNWVEADEDNEVFIALRWDTRRVVSGSTVPGAHVMLRVGESSRNYGTEDPFEIADIQNESLIVGDAMGNFNVDQLVIYSRPLFVSDSVAEDARDELRELASQRGDSAHLMRGSFDVSFATAAPEFGGCDAVEARGWSNSVEPSLGPGEVRAGNSDDWDVPPMGPVPDGELIFRSGMAVGQEPAIFQQRLVAGKSYVYYALVHGQAAPARPELEIEALGQGNDPPLVARGAYLGSLEEPETFAGTFTMPPDATTIEVRLRQGNATSEAPAFFHTLVIRENLLGNSSFEIGNGSQPPEAEEIPEPWVLQAEPDVASRVSSVDQRPNTRFFSICFDGIGNRNHVHQPIAEALNNGEFYAMGASFYWHSEGEGAAPGVSAGNSSFFGTGLPHEFRRRAGGAASSLRDAWQEVGTVAYRLFGEEFSATNDVIFFGGLASQPDSVANFCVDDAYLFPVSPVTGDVGPAL